MYGGHWVSEFDTTFATQRWEFAESKRHSHKKYIEEKNSLTLISLVASFSRNIYCSAIMSTKFWRQFGKSLDLFRKLQKFWFVAQICFPNYISLEEKARTLPTFAKLNIDIKVKAIIW